jgi:DivIVA domain-containing protein
MQPATWMGCPQFPLVWLSASDHLLMDEDDPEKRLAELERRLAEPRAAGDPRANQRHKTPPGWLTPEQIRNMAFSEPRLVRGYNKDEVRWRRYVCCDFPLRRWATTSSMSADNASTPRAGNLMSQVHVERTIAAPPQRVFDWLLDPANLTVSPVLRKAGWAKDSSGPGVGAVREVTGFGFGCTNRSRPTTRPGATPMSLSARSRPRNTRAVRSPAFRRATARRSNG